MNRASGEQLPILGMASLYSPFYPQTSHGSIPTMTSLAELFGFVVIDAHGNWLGLLAGDVENPAPAADVTGVA